MKYNCVEDLMLNTDVGHSIMNRCRILLVAEGVKPSGDVQVISRYAIDHVTEERFRRELSKVGNSFMYDSVPELLKAEFSLEKKLIMGQLCGKIGDSPFISHRELDKLKAVFENLGLVYTINYDFCREFKIHRWDEEGNRTTVPEITINVPFAKDESILNKLISADDSLTAPLHSQQTYGECMGYPGTAIQAWLNNNTLPEEEVPNMGKYEFFKWFRFSRANFDEELETVKRWGETIERVSPLMFKKAQIFQEHFRQNLRKK